MNLCEYNSVDDVDLLEMYLIFGNVGKHFVVANLLEMYLISGDVGKHFVVASRSPRRTPLTTPSKSYVVDVAFSNCRMLTYQRVGLPNLMTRVEVFMNVVSFFETCQRVGLSNLTTKVKVFMNTCLRVGLPNLTTKVKVFMNVYSFLRLLYV
ncbi:hypothetical protein H5410_031375 [Solanum commersonii]|uniref:Uncharacterized protein n=1 Tax=Solanum commersonii TaxID=4109 RepID=A0A9J5YIZ5_SOLCO|nr:hypothetical protein H5410_031375 [Solanum commersonii]